MRTYQEIIEKYRYSSDSELYGVTELWTGLKEVDGKLYGDCEDFCIELKKLDKYKYWDYWYCKLNGMGHCVLMKDGAVVDCNSLVEMPIEVYSGTYAVTGFSKYSKYTIVCKLVVGRIMRLLCGK